MVVYKFPTESNEEKSEPKGEKAKIPDYIYVDESPEENPWGDKEEYYQTIHKLTGQTYSWGLRVFCAFAAIVAWLYVLLMLLLSGITGAIAAVALFSSPAINAKFYRFLKLLCRGSAVFLGTFVAIFSPTFGFGILILYFMLQGEKMDERILSRFVHTV